MLVSIEDGVCEKQHRKYSRFLHSSICIFQIDLKTVHYSIYQLPVVVKWMERVDNKNPTSALWTRYNTVTSVFLLTTSTEQLCLRVRCQRHC